MSKITVSAVPHVPAEAKVNLSLSFGLPCSPSSKGSVQVNVEIMFPDQDDPLVLIANVNLNSALDLQSALNNAIRAAAEP